MIVSYANLKTLRKVLIYKLFIFFRNNYDPNTEPCDTKNFNFLQIVYDPPN